MATSSEHESPGETACDKQAKWSVRQILIRWFKRSAVALVVVLAVGFIWDQMAIRAFETKYPQPGKKVRLPDGRNLHFVIKGEGEPTLVFQSGAGGPHTDWASVIDKLAQTTRVVAYDRAGYDWSDPSSASDLESITRDLRDGLKLLEIDGPIVLVGHSIGGTYIRHYASSYPDRVVGMVFVDSSHEEQRERMPPPMVERMDSISKRVQVGAFASRFGLLHALDSIGASPLASEDTPKRRRAMAVRSSSVRAYAKEISGLPEAFRQAREAAVALGDKPILVLSATVQDEDAMPPSIREHVGEFKVVWNEMQAELAQLSGNSRHVPVAEAKHYVQVDRPDVVVDEIQAMIEAIRNGERLPTYEVPSSSKR